MPRLKPSAELPVTATRECWNCPVGLMTLAAVDAGTVDVNYDRGDD